MANSDNALTSLHRCANDGINPPSVVHNPKENYFRFVHDGANAAWRAGAPVTGWVGQVKFLFQPSGQMTMIAYRLGDKELPFTERQQGNLSFTPSDFSGGVR